MAPLKNHTWLIFNWDKHGKYKLSIRVFTLLCSCSLNVTFIWFSIRNNGKNFNVLINKIIPPLSNSHAGEAVNSTVWRAIESTCRAKMMSKGLATHESQFILLYRLFYHRCTGFRLCFWRWTTGVRQQKIWSV